MSDREKEELALEEEYTQRAEELYERYQEQISAVENKGVFRFVDFSPYHAYALGTMLEQYENYQKFVEYTYGSVSDLGQLPKVALDIISIAYAGSIMPLIASTQPINLTSVGFKLSELLEHPKACGTFNGNNPQDATMDNQQPSLCKVL